MVDGREWMYRHCSGGSLNPDFIAGVQNFISFAASQTRFMDGDNIRCPCVACDNTRYEEVQVVRYHLVKRGFVENYKVWRFHGESTLPINDHSDELGNDETRTTYHEMIMDHARAQFYEEEAPNTNAQGLYDMLKAADSELWPGCKKHTQLSLVSRLMTLKAENNISVACFDQVLELMKEIVPEENLVPKNFL